MTALSDKLRAIADGLDDIDGCGEDAAQINTAADHIDAAIYWLRIERGQPSLIVANRVKLAIRELKGVTQ